MFIGKRIIFEKSTGYVIHEIKEMEGDVLPRKELGELDYIDLPYGQDRDKFMRVKEYHIDPHTKKVVFDSFYAKEETEEERLRREKAELENQLLLKENKELGGIL